MINNNKNRFNDQTYNFEIWISTTDIHLKIVFLPTRFLTSYLK